jgi:hypothetical protein
MMRFFQPLANSRYASCSRVVTPRLAAASRRASSRWASRCNSSYRGGNSSGDSQPFLRGRNRNARRVPAAHFSQALGRKRVKRLAMIRGLWMLAFFFRFHSTHGRFFLGLVGQLICWMSIQ